MTVRSTLPLPLKTAGRALSVQVGSITASRRQLPAFILVGAQRAGTTSLFRALMTHPLIYSANYHKGVNYFDVNYERAFSWYQGHFPTAASLRKRTAGTPGAPITFEASGYYMFHPLAMQRIAQDLPDVKLVAMVRDPVERAYSAWKHESARGFENEDFGTALELEDTRLQGEIEAMTADPTYQSYSHRHHAYRRRGEYVDQLEAVAALVDRSRLHVMYSESFFANPHDEFAGLCQFLGVPEATDIRFDQHNARPSSSIPVGLRDDLRAHFRPKDEPLGAFVGRRVPWADDA